MNKLGLIIKREYLTRVTRRSFILATILTPVGFAIFFIVIGFIFQYKSDDNKRIAVIDQGNILKGTIPDEQNLYFKFETTDLKTLRENFKQYDYDGVLVLPAVSDFFNKTYTAYYYSSEQLTLDVETLIKDRVDNSLRDYKIEGLKLERKQLDALNTRVEIEPEPIDPKAANTTNLTGAVGAGIGSLMGIIMYMTLLIYGMMVMRSVMEEKTSRIVEVMISSVKPFQLMLGKISGVGLVGLTQLAIWAILIPSISLLINLVFGFDLQKAQMNGPGGGDSESTQAMMALAVQELTSQNWMLILPLFVVYFLGGYFLYASLYAAVGSAMGDDLGEGQALTLPITIPVIIAFYIMFVAVQAPNSSLAVWASIFPLFSPVVMPARLAFGPPWWQIVLSLAVLIGTCIFFIWLAGRIYRVGILMYGKKVSMKELAKWIFYKE